MNYIEMLKNSKMSDPENLKSIRDRLMKDEREKPYYAIQEKNGDFQFFTGIRFTSKVDRVENSVESRHNWTIFHRMSADVYIDVLYEKAIEHMSPSVWEKRTCTVLPDRDSIIDAFSDCVDSVIFGDLSKLLPDTEPETVPGTVNDTDIFVEIAIAVIMVEGRCTEVYLKSGAYNWVAGEDNGDLHRVELGSSYCRVSPNLPS